MTDGGSLINIGELSKPATVLVEKVCAAIGIVYEPIRIKRRAAAEAVAEKTTALARIEISDLERRAIERMVAQESRKQENIESITLGAASNIGESAKPEQIDEDWIAHFFDQCATVSNKEMQVLWAKLLSDEATLPGKVSKRTVNLLATLEKDDAILFEKLGQFCLNLQGRTLIILDYEHSIYSSQGINFMSLKHLDSLGLVSLEAFGYTHNKLPKRIGGIYQEQLYMFEFPADTENSLDIGKVLLTTAGQQLAAIFPVLKNADFVPYLTAKWAESNVKLTGPVNLPPGFNASRTFV